MTFGFRLFGVWFNSRRQATRQATPPLSSAPLTRPQLSMCLGFRQIYAGLPPLAWPKIQLCIKFHNHFWDDFRKNSIFYLICFQVAWRLPLWSQVELPSECQFTNICVHFDLEVIFASANMVWHTEWFLDIIHASFDFAAISIDLFALPFQRIYTFSIFISVWKWPAFVLIGLTALNGSRWNNAIQYGQYSLIYLEYNNIH